MQLVRTRRSVAFLAAVVIIALAAPATASVTVGADPQPASVAFSAYTKSPIAFAVDPPGPPSASNWVCGSAALAGGITPKITGGGLGAASIHGSSWSNCAFISLDLNVYHTPGSRWMFNAATPNAANDVWTGTITNISAHVQSKPAGVCAFDIVGTAAAILTEAQVAGNNSFTQTLALNQPTTGQLAIANISGCLGQFSNGWPIGMTGSFKIYNSLGLIDIQP